MANGRVLGEVACSTWEPQQRRLLDIVSLIAQLTDVLMREGDLLSVFSDDKQKTELDGDGFFTSQ